MGPTIILDKSAFQCLNPRETSFLYRHFLLSTPQILIREIVADLTKKPGESEYRVAQLIGKFRPLRNYFQTSYEEVCVSNLLGHHYPMDGRIVMSGGRDVVDEDGSRGVVFDPDPQWDLMRKWEKGVFSEEDVRFSRDWRESLKQIDWGKFVSTNRFQKTTKARNLDDLYLELMNLYSRGNLKQQLRHINVFMDNLNLPVKVQNEVGDRFLDSEKPTFWKYANYAYFCFLLNQTFAVGLVHGMVSTRSSSFLDLEYIFYLPFCQVFVSNDDFQLKLANIFKGPFHTIANGMELKKGLSGLADRYEAMSQQECEQYEYNFGSYPPLDDQSIVSDIWKKYCRPWKPKSGNLARDSSPKEARKIIEHITNRMKKEVGKNPPP